MTCDVLLFFLFCAIRRLLCMASTWKILRSTFNREFSQGLKPVTLQNLCRAIRLLV